MKWNPTLSRHAHTRWIIYTALLLGSVIFLLRQHSLASPTNDFDLEHSLIPTNEIYHGGPPRDGIPAIDKPAFIPARDADFLKPDDRVLGLSHNGISKAYAVRILNYHEIVNDSFAQEAIVISYCPLCGTGMAFRANIAGLNRSFGVSGLLYNSDMLLYDRQSESLWSQIRKQAVTGPLKGTRLEQIPMLHTSWQDWLAEHPETLVLSTKTGYLRNYELTPYPGYETSRQIMFPISHRASQYHPKERVLGLEINNTFKVYPFAELAKSGKRKIRDTVAGTRVTILFDAKNRSGKIIDLDDRVIPTVNGYWFAWMAFHPESEIYKVEQ